MSGLTAQVSRELGAIPGVEDVGGHVGRALTGDRSSTSTPAPSLSRSAAADYDATQRSTTSWAAWTKRSTGRRDTRSRRSAMSGRSLTRKRRVPATT